MYTIDDAGRKRWSLRNRLGEFCRADGTNRSLRAWTLAAWRAYVEARCNAAERDTNGYVAKPGRWVSITRAIRASTSSLSDEMRDWLEEHGPTLSYRAFCAQMCED